MKKKIKVLFVDDEKNFRQIMVKELGRLGFDLGQASQGREALEILRENQWDVVVLDLDMPEMGGLEVLQKMEGLREVEVVVLTGKGTVESAVKAMKLGACDFLEKPCSLEELEVVLYEAYEKKQLKVSNENWQQVQESHLFDYELVGHSQAMEEVRKLLHRVAPSAAPVLLEGESGTGKELVAREIHRLSPRRVHPFVDVNCANLTSSLFESTLFGHSPGAFTGAGEGRKGLAEVAQEGTLFLDEISEISPENQAKLLRFLETSTFRRVGENEKVSVDVRILAATNRNLEKEVKEGHFRRDLYFRLHVISISIPPLRQRKEDLPLLVEYFLNSSPQGPTQITSEALEFLKNYHWPGNIRELKNAIERVKILSPSETIETADLQSFLSPSSLSRETLPATELTLEDVQRAHIIRVLKELEGNKTQAAKCLGISLKTLYNKIDQYDIDLGG